MSSIATAVFFGLAAFALVMAALSGAAMAWDGSYQFFVALDSQEPYILHGQRYIVLVGQGAALVSSQFTGDVALLRILFGLGYALVPIGALLLSWLAVRDGAPWLFVWPTLAIGNAIQPGQQPLDYQAPNPAQLFWPLLLLVLVDAGSRWQPVVIVLALVLMLTHPSAIPMLGLAAAVALWLANRHAESRTRHLLQAGFLGVVTAAALVDFLINKSSYETEHLNLDTIVSSFRAAVFGPAIVALGLVYLAGMILIVLPLVRRGAVALPDREARLPRLRAAALLAVAGAGVVLLIRAVILRWWWSSLDYRFWMLLGTLPFLGLAVLEGVLPRSWGESFRAEMSIRSRIMLLAAVVFSVVLSANSLGWLRLTDRLENTLASRSEACIPMSSIDWIHKTALDHWSTTAYSLVLQGRRPTKIVLADEDACAAISPDHAPITDWYTRPWDDGWFDLEGLDQHLARAP